MMLVVKLDDPKYPGNGGRVVAHVASIAEYQRKIEDRDGARRPEYRLWEGIAPIGARVKLK